MNKSENNKIHTIAYFLDYGKYFGGAVNTLLQQALLMKKAGCLVIIFLSDYYGRNMELEYKEICSQYDIKILYETFQISSQPEDIDVICLDENYDALKEKIQEVSPDILHSVQINPMAELIGRELGIPHIMNIYPLLSEFFSIRYMDIFPHYHICDSWYWAKRWKQYLNTDYTCIRTTVNMNACIKQPIVSGEKVKYICVGDIYENKNQLNIIKAFHTALNAGAIGHLDFFGYDGRTYAEECKNYIKWNDLTEYISIEGFCSNMKEIYRRSDVLICGSKRESYPNVISEAMAFGLIIISTPVAGVPEVVKDGINGYLSDDYTAEAISRKILEFNKDIGNKKLENIRQCVYETFMKNHYPEVVAENLKQYYFHVISDAKRKPDISIIDIRKAFSVWKSIYYQNYSAFSEPQIVAVKIWYLFHAKEYIESAVYNKARFFVWGAGKFGRSVVEMVGIFFPKIIISGFLDSKKTGRFFSYKIYKPEEILQKENVIIFVAAVRGQNEMIKRLEQNNYIFNRNYFIFSPRVW